MTFEILGGDNEILGDSSVLGLVWAIKSSRVARGHHKSGPKNLLRAGNSYRIGRSFPAPKPCFVNSRACQTLLGHDVANLARRGQTTI